MWVNINGNWIGRHSGQKSWSPYWAQHFSEFQTNLFAQDDLNFWTKSRSGNQLVDEYGNNATIKTPTLRFSGTSSGIRVSTAGVFTTGGTAWDVTFKFKIDDHTRRDCLFYNGGNANGTKGITIMPYNGNLVIYSSDGTNAYRTITMSCGFQDNVDYTLRFQWDGQTDGTVTVTVNGTVYSSTNVRGWAGSSGGGFVDFASYAAAFSFKGLFYSAAGTICGDLIDFHPMALTAGVPYCYDLSVAGRPLTFALYNYTSVFEGNSTYCLDHGYSVQVGLADEKTYYFPNDSDGNFVSMYSIIAGGTETISQHEGSLTKHNLFPSYVSFAGDFFNRSDTTIWNDTSRDSAYYNALLPKDFYITELNFKTLKSWLNVGYKGVFFIKADEQSVEDTTTIDELFCYTTDKTSHDEIKALIYSNDVRRCQRAINGDYVFDSDDYAEIYLYDDLGGDAEANYAKYQALINSGNLTLVAGYNEYDVISIARPLKVPSNRTLTVNCELRIKDASFANLTGNVTIGDKVIPVDDISVFAVGDHVAISDDLLPTQGGGSQTRSVAACGVITEIGAGTITLNNGSNYNISSGDGGKVGHCQPVILIESVSNVNIYGSGIINARWQKQYDVESVWDSVEALKFGSGIAVIESQDCKVLGTPLLRVRNAVLHNIVFTGDFAAGTLKINGEIGNIDTGYAHDKNILFTATDGIYLHDVEAHHSVFEDGVTFYINNINMLVEDIYEHDNSRVGVNLMGNGICNAVLNRIRCSKALQLLSSSVVLSDVVMDTYAYLTISSFYSGGNDIEINGITFTDIVVSKLITIEGAVDGVVINDCEINGCNTSTAAINVDELSGGGVYPQNVEFNGGGIYDHTGDAYAIDASADVTFTDFDNAPA